MKIHRRELITQKAETALNNAIIAVCEEHKLTYIELVRILADAIQLHSKYALREERHPNHPDKPAGLA